MIFLIFFLLFFIKNNISSDFFKENIVHLFDNIQIDTFEKSIDSSMFYSDIEVGYAKSAYEEISGLVEFNNIEKYNIKIDEEILLISSNYSYYPYK